MKELKGKVTMDLSEYNYLLQEAIKYRGLIYVDQTYGDSIDVKVDIASIKDEIVKMAKEKYPEVVIREDAFDGRWNTPSANIGKVPVEEIVED